MKSAINAALFMSMAVPALAQSEYYVCQVDHVAYYINQDVDIKLSAIAQAEYLGYDFSLPVEEIEKGVAGPEGVFFHDRQLDNGDFVVTEINGDLELEISIQLYSVSPTDWIIARGKCE